MENIFFLFFCGGGILALAVVAFNVWRRTVIRINDREMGLVLRRGAATDKVLDPGEHTLTPFVESIVTYPSHELTYLVVEDKLVDTVQGKEADFADHPLDITTADKATANILYTVRCRISKSGVRHIHDRFGRNGIKGVIRDESRHIIRLALNEKNYTARDLLGSSRAQVEMAISERLKERLAANGLEMTHFGLREADLGELGKQLDAQMRTIEELKLEQEKSNVEAEKNRRAEQKAQSDAMIESKRVKSKAEADAEAKRIQAETDAQIEAERMKRQAEADAETKKIQAEADAAARKIQAEADKIQADAQAYIRVKQAEAEAQANKLLAESITDEVAKYQQMQAQLSAAQKWDGKLPLLSGQGAFPFINLTSLLNPQSDESSKGR